MSADALTRNPATKLEVKEILLYAVRTVGFNQELCCPPSTDSLKYISFIRGRRAALSG
jgi:hypothetical protein